MLLLQRALVGVTIGVLPQEDMPTQVKQVTILMCLYASLAVYLIVARPFINRRSNIAEAVVAGGQNVLVTRATDSAAIAPAAFLRA